MSAINNYLKKLNLLKIPKRTKCAVNQGSNFNPEQYTNKIILAPMVTCGTLPTRLLSLRFGADLVYTDEIIDTDLLRCKRVVNDAIKTIDYVDSVNKIIKFRTCAEERSKVILQIGTCDPDRAIGISKLVQNDVAGIDINMGCPKDFSIKRRIGAALLSRPDQVSLLLTQLVRHSKVPVTCKIRVFTELEPTLKLTKLIQDCGVSAIAVHGRTKRQESKLPNNNEFIRAISETLTIPVIANGGSLDIENYEDINRFKEETNCNSVMIARAAEFNPSVFRKEGPLDVNEVAPLYLRTAIDCDNDFDNTHENLKRMLWKRMKCPESTEFSTIEKMQDMCDKWGLLNYYNEAKSQGRISNYSQRGVEKELSIDEAMEAIKLELKYVKLKGKIQSQEDLKSNVNVQSKRIKRTVAQA